jgi:hypothetical protein
VIDPAIGKGREAVSALLGDQTIARFRFVGAERQAEHHQFFTKELDCLDRFVLGQLTGYGHRMPIAAQQFTGRRARSNACQCLVFVLPHACLIAQNASIARYRVWLRLAVESRIVRHAAVEAVATIPTTC